MTTCATCGVTTQDETNFCRSCGASIDRQLRDSETTQISPLPTSAPASPLPGYAPPSQQQPAASAAPPAPAPTRAESTASPFSGATARNMPTGSDIKLLPGERQLHQATFTPKMFTPHLKSELVLTEERLLVRHPTTIFVFFPTGYQLSVAELGKIDQLNHGTILRSTKLVWGGAAALFGLIGLLTGGAFFGGGGLGTLISLIMLAVGVVLILTARVNAILAETGGGKLAVIGQGAERSSLEDTAYRISVALREIRVAQ